MDVSVRVGVGAVAGVGVNAQGFNLYFSLIIILFISSLPPTTLDSSGARLRSGSLMI